MRTYFYTVTTTHPGADGPTSTLYRTRKQAREYLDTCRNGEIRIAEVLHRWPLDWFNDGGTIGEIFGYDYTAFASFYDLKSKETAVAEYMDMIRESWTWAKMTDDEHERFENLIEQYSHESFDGHIRGSFSERWRQMQLIYDAYLAGLGYTNGNWR